MVRDKEKKEIVSKTKVPSTENLSAHAELPENPQNKTDDIEVISAIVSTIDENNLNSSTTETPAKSSNQTDTTQEERPVLDDQSPEDFQKSEPEEKKSPIFPMLLGGIITGTIGFGAAYYLFTSNILTNGITINDVQSELSVNISGNTNSISQNTKTNGDQDTQLQNIMAKLETHSVQLKTLNGSLESMVNLSKTLDDLKVRVESIEMLTADMSQLVAKLEKRPVNATLSTEVIAAYNSEVTKLIETMAAQRKKVVNLLGEATAKKAQASKIERRTQANLTFTAIQTAFKTGESFATELNEFSKLTNAQIPADLQKIASEGVQRLEALTHTFPEVARAAIAAERSGNSYDGTIQSLLGFLKSQVQARSVTPKEGTDADAVLSRAEAALRDGKLDKAVEELQALQSPAKEAMAEWQAEAQQRLNLVQALNSLSAVVEN